ncbi:MAG TPA: glutamine-hydrolyzing carbamoyl-phosphate synthase small subunit [Spirochaetia bacterium]|nr:glutamine-hydrolyzing carbamoyl-phosphate synthase small subunit [Spirochaetia bacterium]
MSCFLVLQDGTIFPGRAFGHPAPKADSVRSAGMLRAVGEVVFNTAMCGYHEVLTDPSYAGQLVTMTYPHMGNYGTDDEWSETRAEDRGVIPGIKPAGFIVRSLYRGPIPDGRTSLDAFLRRNQTPGISEVDTRALTLKIREGGSQKGVIVRAASRENSLTAEELAACVSFLAEFPDMEGRNLIGDVGTEEVVSVNESGSPHMLLVDCGIKANIVRELLKLNCRVTLTPSGMSSSELLQFSPDAVLYSNGPGDPAVLEPTIRQIRGLIGKLPVFGICLGHQLIALALGASTYKMKFGHHGVNHPVRDEKTKRVFITSQNHGFAVEEGSLPAETEVWFRNANDNSVEGLAHTSLPILTAQFHPESAPGPHDSSWIFEEFLSHIKE